MPETLAVPPLVSGGLMLGYACNQSCRHCNYRCGPDAGGTWMDRETLAEALAALKRERRLIDIHLAGGEATLKPELLREAVALASGMGIRIAYLETNGFFADSAEKAVKVLSPLRDAGLPAILLSVSPYHNEFIPLQKTLNCLEAGRRVFGEDGVFPWLHHFLPLLAKLDPDVPHPLDEFLGANGFEPGDRRLLRLFPLTPGGRVPERMREFFDPRPADAFRGGLCLDILADVTHFHVDPEGRLFTGHCPGITAGFLPDWHGERNFDNAPVFTTLAFGGPHTLMRLAERECGFAPRPDGYASPCELCFAARKALFLHDPGAWPELGPAAFYRD